MAFQPNKNPLAACMSLIDEIQKDLKLNKDKIFTSLDVGDLYKHHKAIITNIPGGFSKILLPFNTSGPATFYISSGAPDAVVPRHSHDEGAGVRFIVSGSIIFDGRELKQGDWMYLPAKAEYEFVVGHQGVTIFYCYQCCCA